MFEFYRNIIPAFFVSVKCIKMTAAYAAVQFLLFPEGHTVGALILGRIRFVSAYLNLFQRAVIIGIAVISALGYGAGNALVDIVVHGCSSFSKVHH